MVSFNALSKLCVVVAFGYSATVSSTDVAQEQPKESLVSRFFGKKDDHDTKTVEVTESKMTETQEHSESGEPPKYSVEWYLLPKEENRKELRGELPWYCRDTVPKDFNEPMLPVIEKKIRKYFSLSGKKQRSRRLSSFATLW